MKKPTMLLAVSLVLLLMGFACKKDNSPHDQLPPATQTGKNTFGCYINGKLFVAQGRVWGSPNPGATYLNDEYNDHMVSAGGRIYSDTIRQSLGFSIQKGTQPQKYYFTTSSIRAYFFDSESGCNYSPTSNQLNRGWIEITRFDTIEGVLSGLFEFDLVLDSLTYDPTLCDSVLHITQGRFDCTLR
jgi:hypothetical protein